MTAFDAFGHVLPRIPRYQVNHIQKTMTMNIYQSMSPEAQAQLMPLRFW